MWLRTGGGEGAFGCECHMACAVACVLLSAVKGTIQLEADCLPPGCCPNPDTAGASPQCPSLCVGGAGLLCVGKAALLRGVEVELLCWRRAVLLWAGEAATGAGAAGGRCACLSTGGLNQPTIASAASARDTAVPHASARVKISLLIAHYFEPSLYTTHPRRTLSIMRPVGRGAHLRAGG